MAITIRAVRLQAPATNIMQDYAIASMGAAQAVIVFSGLAGDGSDTDGINCSIGFWDTSTVISVSTHAEHGVAIAVGRAANSEDGTAIVEIHNHDSTVDRTATPSAITDGIQLSWAGSDLTVRPWTVVILINGINGAKAGALTPDDTEGNSATASALGITPKVIFGSQNRRNAGDGPTSHKNMALGFAYDTGSGIDQNCFTWKRDVNTVSCFSNNITNRISGEWGTSSIGSTQEITAMASGEFTSFTRDGSGASPSDLFFLALDFDEDAAVFQSQVPTTNVDWVPLSGASFTPIAAIMVPSFAATRDIVEGDENAGFFGLYVCNADEEFGFGFCDEDAASINTNTSSRSDTELIIQNDTAGIPDFAADTPIFTSGTITYDATTAGEGSIASYVTGIAFGSAAAPPPSPLSAAGIIVNP